MAEVPNLKKYIQRAMRPSNPGEGLVDGGLTAPVDLLNIGMLQNLQFHRDGLSLEDAMAEFQTEFVARVAELNALLEPEDQDDPDAQRVNYNQAINEIFGPVVFSLEVLLKAQSNSIEQLWTRVIALSTTVA